MHITAQQQTTMSSAYIFQWNVWDSATLHCRCISVLFARNALKPWLIYSISRMSFFLYLLKNARKRRKNENTRIYIYFYCKHHLCVLHLHVNKRRPVTEVSACVCFHFNLLFVSFSFYFFFIFLSIVSRFCCCC